VVETDSFWENCWRDTFLYENGGVSFWFECLIDAVELINELVDVHISMKNEGAVGQSYRFLVVFDQIRIIYFNQI